MQYYPSKAETRACGSLGISIFLFIFSLSFYSLLNRFKNIETKSFYILTMIMSIFEFPRYFSMVVVGDYNSVDCYASHIIADLLYFLCLAAVILTFTSILELGPYASAIYSKRGLFLAAICQATINFTAVIYCVHSSSLMSFFSSLLYELFTCFDFIQNFLYTSVIALHGAQLINRFQNLNDYATSAFEKEVFKGLVIKLTRILLVVSLFTLSRLAILLLKVSSRYSPKPVTTPIFTYYGLIWFALSDFIPRGATSIALCFLMRSRQVERIEPKVTADDVVAIVSHSRRFIDPDKEDFSAQSYYSEFSEVDNPYTVR